MIKFTEVTKRRAVRETTATFEYNDPKTGEKVIEENFRVRYWSLTNGEVKQLREDALAKAKLAEEDETAVEYPWLSTTLAVKLESLPDLVDDKGNPVEITVEVLDKITVLNLRAIDNAIEEDIRPKEQQSK